MFVVADDALVPVVGRELERQQRLLLHGAARVVPSLSERGAVEATRPAYQRKLAGR